MYCLRRDIASQSDISSVDEIVGQIIKNHAVLCAVSVRVVYVSKLSVIYGSLFPEHLGFFLEILEKMSKRNIENVYCKKNALPCPVFLEGFIKKATKQKIFSPWFESNSRTYFNISTIIHPVQKDICGLHRCSGSSTDPIKLIGTQI